jgi:predicted secreted hydrolase
MKILFAFIIITSFFSITVFSQNWQQYPYSPVGSTISFPLDDGPHTTNTTTEWWYINLHLIGSAPAFKKYDVMLCYFSKPANMRIFNIADPESGLFDTDVNRTQFALSEQAGHWGLTYSPMFISDYSNWTYPTDNVPYRYVFHAENPFPYNGDELDITVTGNRPPLNVGSDGYIAIGDQGDFSYYYSYTNMTVVGSIKFNGTTDVISSGIGWIDRQYGPFTVGINTANQYEWYSMQLDKPGVTWGTPQTPSEFNIWQIYNDTNNIPISSECRSVSAIYPDNSQDTTSDFIYERTSYWYDATNNVYYSSSWRMINPAQDLNLDMTPTITNQVIDVTLFKFWEGGTVIKGIVQGQPVDGVGFAELVAKHNSAMVCPSIPTGLHVSYQTNHYQINWNASTAGTFPIGGYRVYRSTSNDGYWKYIGTTTGLTYNDYAASTDTLYYYTVSSFDNQTAISASGYAAAITNIKNITEDDNSIMVYPNPANNQITIDFPAFTTNNNTKMELLNLDGKLLKNKNIVKSKTQLDVSDLPSGIYVLKLTDNNGIMVKRFTKK